MINWVTRLHPNVIYFFFKILLIFGHFTNVRDETTCKFKISILYKFKYCLCFTSLWYPVQFWIICFFFILHNSFHYDTRSAAFIIEWQSYSLVTVSLHNIFPRPEPRGIVGAFDRQRKGWRSSWQKQTWETLHFQIRCHSPSERQSEAVLGGFTFEKFLFRGCNINWRRWR